MFNCTKTFYEDIKKANEGRLINISSVIGKQGNYGQSNYATRNPGCSAVHGRLRSNWHTRLDRELRRAGLRQDRYAR